MATSVLPVGSTLPVTMVSAESLADKTTMIKLSFERFGNEKKARVRVNNADGAAVVVADETTIVTKAKANRFSHNKRLLDSPELKAIALADKEIREFVDSRCVPYDEGVRLCPDENLDEVYQRLVDYAENVRPQLVDAACAVYPEQRAQAEADLQDQFNPQDFPPVDVFRSRFNFTFKILTFGVPGKLKKTNPAVWKAERQKAASDLSDAVELIKSSLRVAFHEMVSGLADTLTPSADGKKKRLHPVTVEKLQTFLNQFDIRNVTDDTELKTQVDKLKLIMSGVDADMIKESENLKSSLQKEFTEVSQVLSTMVEVKGRKFRD